MLTEDKVTEIFVLADEFSKVFDAALHRRGLEARKPARRKYRRPGRMSDAEIITILVMFHMSNHKCLKHFYLDEICAGRWRRLFPEVLSYNRFTELEKSVAVKLAVFVKKCLLGKCTGISFVDSTLLRVCRSQRERMHRVFKGLAAKGKSSLGWFYGFKLHLICNDRGEILNFMITPGNVDDREPLKIKNFVNAIYGKLVGDKGYISKSLFNRLFFDGIQLITRLKSNMRGGLRSIGDRILLRKRAVIETINDELKNIAQIEHTRHRSFANFVANLAGGLAAYCFFPKKPSINIERIPDKQLAIF